MNSAHISDRSKTFSYSWCSTLRTCLIFSTGFIIKEIEAKLKILFLGLLFSQLLLPFNFDTPIHFDKRKWYVRNKAGRKKTEWEVLFNTDFTSAEVYNKVSADHSLLKALTNNTLLQKVNLTSPATHDCWGSPWHTLISEQLVSLV